MPIPFLATLAPRIRALFPIIEAGVARGISSRNINAAIKDATGTGIKRQTLLDVMRKITGLAQKQSQLKFLTRGSVPNINRLPEALTKIRRKLSFRVLVKGFLIDTGEEIFQHVTLTMNAPLTRGRLEDMATELLDDRQERYGMEVLTATLVSGVRAGLAGTL